MRIGIFPELNPLSGGTYQYGLSMLHALREMTGRAEDEFVIFSYPETKQQAVRFSNGSNLRVESVLPPTARRRVGGIVQRVVGQKRLGKVLKSARHLAQSVRWRGGAKTQDPDVVRQRNELSRWLRHSCGIELMLYPASSSLSFETELPSVMAIHDLQHRLQPEFPEVSANEEWARREYLFRNAARRATLLLADSEVGREDILNLYGEYGVTPDRVKVLPFLPSPYLATNLPSSERRRVRSLYGLPERYLFYPAQFWPHKNHARIVEAMGQLKEEHRLEVHIVLCGSHGGEIREHTFREVLALARRLKVDKQIRYLGYVPDEDMSGLYAEAEALVMPTLFGPTNIPVLEAWALDCPVLTSDMRGTREQAADAALLVNPRSTEALADGIYRLWTDEQLRAALVRRGRERLDAYGQAGYLKCLKEIIEEAKSIVAHERTINMAF